ncbi:hypothetical protein [Sorangium sp. So ce117]|uniref:hypothetical protein n=1 Tax=Sorangium sp. So ce117 TaxID=3133277 RepID=UPI003F64062E
MAGGVRLESLPFRVDDSPARIGVDVRTPDENYSWAGNLEVSLDCASRSIRHETVGRVELAPISTGRFETISLPLPPSLRERLAGGCEDLVVRFAVDTSSSVEAISFDRLELGYHVGVVASPLCGVSPLPPDAEEELPDGYLRRHVWRSGASVQFELARLQEAIASEPEILGITADDALQHFIAVVDAGTDEELTAVAERLQRLEPTVPLVVQPSCRSGSELRRALEVIQTGSFHSRAPEVELLYLLDVAEGRYVVFADAADADVAEALQGALGALVTIESRPFGEHGRFNDGEPHYGAAAIETDTGVCTAGFVVNWGLIRGAVTAGHCVSAAGEFVYSGPEFWGEAGHFPANTTAWDMVYVGPSFPLETYSARIHTDPCCPVTRPVTSKVNPANGQIVCISGRNYLAKCSVEVFNMQSTWVIDGNARSNVWFGRRTGVNIAAPADSGAPIYIPVGVGNAAIVGMHIAGFVVAPFDQTWFHSVANIETQLGVTVAF